MPRRSSLVRLRLGWLYALAFPTSNSRHVSFNLMHWLHDHRLPAVHEQRLPVTQRVVRHCFGAVPGPDLLDGSRLRMPR